MAWGLFGPLTVRTKRGTRLTFVAGFITLPLTALSLYQLFKGPSPPRPPPPPTPRELDLSRVE